MFNKDDPWAYIKISGMKEHNEEVDRNIDRALSQNALKSLLQQERELTDSSIQKVTDSLNDLSKTVNERLKLSSNTLNNRLNKITQELKNAEEANAKENKAMRKSNLTFNIISLIIAGISVLLAIVSFVYSIFK